MRKLFVFDLDGTLLDSGKQISDRTKNALKSILQRGHKIAIATARPPRATQHVVDRLGFRCDFAFYNGSLIRTLDFGEFNVTIPNNDFKNIYQWLRKNDPGSVLSIEYSDRWVTDHEYDFQKHFQVSEGPSMVPTGALMEMAPNKILVNCCGSPDDLRNEFSSLLNVLVTDNGTLVQIMPKGASKENAIESILDLYGIGFENVTCFGDDHNDTGLFKRCGNSVAMGNAIRELKQIATHHTETNDNDGVASFIEKMGLTNS